MKKKKSKRIKKPEKSFFSLSHLSYTRPSRSVSSSEIANSENRKTGSSEPVTDSESGGKRDEILGGSLSPRATARLCARVLMHSKRWSAATKA